MGITITSSGVARRLWAYVVGKVTETKTKCGLKIFDDLFLWYADAQILNFYGATFAEYVY